MKLFDDQTCFYLKVTVKTSGFPRVRGIIRDFRGSQRTEWDKKGHLKAIIKPFRVSGCPALRSPVLRATT